MAEAPKLPKLDLPSVDCTLYPRGFGFPVYAIAPSRPDIAYTTGRGLLAQHVVSSGKQHWSAWTRVLRYSQITKHRWIVYYCLKSLELIGYVNVDYVYAGDLHMSCSTAGWTFMSAGGRVAWSSRKQPITSLSGTGSEYVAAASTAQDLIWIQGFLSELGFIEIGPTTLFTDNQSSMTLAKNPGSHKSTEYIRVKYYVIRGVVTSKGVELKSVPTGEQVAGVLTKPLGRLKFPIFVSGMGMY
ncbi:unnamed protein product [Rhizoctonia solani]|uniref:Retrovirus-related Pol polyprotein from transposon TNT 1-94 n=1 Tax=Rhizoctonia solani TaxID=456999 RepID=A0A8H2XYQ9_9AGAM|nr:unnamed protein product [Rhizoctonia solani]